VLALRPRHACMKRIEGANAPSIERAVADLAAERDRHSDDDVVIDVPQTEGAAVSLSHAR
jgi:hypothetical protein